MLVEKTIKNLSIHVDVTGKDITKYLNTAPVEELQGFQKVLDSKLPEKEQPAEKEKPAPTDDEVEAFLDDANKEQLEYFLSVIEDRLDEKKGKRQGTIISIEVQCLGHGLDHMAAEKLEEYINRVGLDTAAEQIVSRG